MEELQQIELGDGAYNIENTAAEDALQGIADQAGLSKEQILDLIQAIQQLNQTDVETNTPTETPTEQPDTTKISGAATAISMPVSLDDSQVQSDTDKIKTEVESTDAEVKPKLDISSLLSMAQNAISGISSGIQGAFSGGGKQQTTEAKVNMDTSGAEKGASQVDKSMKQLSKESATAKVNVDATQALSAINSIRANLMTISGTNIDISVNSNSLVTAASRAASLSAKLSEVIAKKAQAGALGTAHASGTAKTGIVSRISSTISRAFAGGSGQDWTVGKHETALINELGPDRPESIVHNGIWSIIPGGPQVADLSPSDIIFSADQTEDLIESGKTLRAGKLVAHSKGTADGMPAYKTGKNKGKLGSKTTKKNNSQGGGNGGNGGNGKTNKNNNNKNQDKQNAFEKWVEKLFDWIEVRLDRIQRRIDTATQKAENAWAAFNASATNSANVVANIQAKNSYVSTAMQETRTLISNNEAGRDRYASQAEQVLNQAQNTKIKSGKKNVNLISGNLAAEIRQKVADGTIDIIQYSKEVQTVISEYQKWHEKSLDCAQAVDELNAQLKELQQTKLDNITDQFDAWVGFADAVRASSEAAVDYYTTIGTAINSKDREQMNEQLNRQREATALREAEWQQYYEEMQRAQSVFGVGSVEYKNAEIKLNEINKSIIESKTAEEKLTQTMQELPFTLREKVISRIEKTVSRLSSIVQLIEKRGTVRAGASSAYATNATDTRQYIEQQIGFNNDLIEKRLEDIDARRQQIENEINSGKLSTDSERYDELYGKLTQSQDALISLLSTQEDLKQAIHTLNWKKYDDWKKTVETISSELSHIQGFIREDEMYTETGKITKRGWANVAIIGEQMDLAESKISMAREALNKYNDELKAGTISEEEYAEKSAEAYETIQSAAESLFDQQQKLADMQIEAWNRENETLQNLIDRRKEALQKKQEYYEWDKQIKQKNKDISQLQAQISALQGVSNDATKARRAKLQAELQEKQQDLKDTRYEHQLDIQSQGYEKLSEDMQEALDRAVKLIQSDNSALLQTSQQMLAQLEINKVDEANIINGIVQDRRTSIHDETSNAINETIGSNINTLATKTGDIQSAIGTKTDKSILDFSSEIKTTIDSKGNNISETIANLWKDDGAAKLNFDAKFKELESTISQATKDLATKFPANTATTAATPSGGGGGGTSPSANSSEAEQEAEIARKRAQLDQAVSEFYKWHNQIQKDKNNKKVSEWRQKRKAAADIIRSLGGQVAVAANGTITRMVLPRFAKGSKRIDEDQLAWTNENWDKNGSEMIIRKSDNAILTPLKADDAVIPANLVDNLFKWGAINPDSFSVNPFMGKWGDSASGTKQSEMFNNNTSTQNVDVHFDSLITVQGNVDADVVNRLEDLSKSLTSNKDFQQNVIKFVTKDFVKESKKRGIR